MGKEAAPIWQLDFLKGKNPVSLTGGVFNCSLLFHFHFFCLETAGISGTFICFICFYSKYISFARIQFFLCVAGSFCAF